MHGRIKAKKLFALLMLVGCYGTAAFAVPQTSREQDCTQSFQWFSSELLEAPSAFRHHFPDDGAARRIRQLVLRKVRTGISRQDLHEALEGTPVLTVKEGSLLATVSAFLQDKLHMPTVVLTEPSTPSTSGAKIFVAGGSGLPLVVKVLSPKQDVLELVTQVASLDLMESAQLTKSGPVRMVAVGRIENGPDTHYFYAMERAPGSDIQSWIRAAVADPMPLFGAVGAVGHALAELHTAFPPAKNGHWQTKDYQAYETSRLELLHGSESIIHRLQKENPHWLTPAEATAAVWQSREIIEAYRRVPLERPVVFHGDAHPGNFAYDPSSQVLRFFDVGNLMWSTSVEEDGQIYGTADPASDLGHFTGALEAAAVLYGVPKAYAKSAQHVFLQAYLSSRQQKGEDASLAFEDLASRVSLFRLRYDDVLLRRALPNHTEAE